MEPAFAHLGNPDLVSEIHQQLDELQRARDQTEKLLHVIMGISSDLELDATLDRIANAAITLTGARYGALGVRDSGGALSSFLHQGIDPGLVERIGPLPVGKGVLGVPLEDTPALRLDDLADHPAAAGFPPHHPPMHAFLGVPITIRGEVYGSLYVTHDRPGPTFSVSDEVSVRVLASAAAVAIDNARLFERIRAAATWVQASREISTALLSGGPGSENPLRLIAERARELTDAEQAIVLVPEAAGDTGDSQTLVVSTAVGLHAEEVIGQRVPIDSSSSGSVFRSEIPVITESFLHPIRSFTDIGQRPAIIMPLTIEDNVIGVIAVARNRDEPAFDPSYLDLVRDFARHAAIALTLASSRARERELLVLADRERIAHDLHDHVIQRLFAAGLDVQGTIARSKAPEVNNRLTRTVDELQSTIETIRSTIFKLQSPASKEADLRVRLQALVSEMTGDSGIVTSVHVAGPLSVVTQHISEHAEAVASEAISNAVRHANASHIDVTVTVNDQFTVEIADDGQGIPEDNMRSSGLANMQRRAEHLGGECTISSAPESGTSVRWTVPLLAG
ncbi:GAF domain-containing protein [Mycolicibacterium sp. P9-22]|uniref:sensor histidine kinase n=1 Tax=Mycolicibacterium sp. P9-22 TaxID=2024613 RepID=UPI0011EF2A23|nr:GAF domain-containing protein [Mycolicibacterium sp. P9-22]KAA0118341.1 GAF domain-containing protein [Mycolicibacterium sp. P9-22]